MRPCLPKRYFELYCETCSVLFTPIIGTEPNELLHPDMEQLAEQAGQSNTDAFTAFVEEHRGHRLIEREVETQ